jgi:hypothetical protein
VNLETSKKERLPLRFSRRSYDVHIEAPHLIEIFMLRVRYILRGPASSKSDLLIGGRACRSAGINSSVPR